MKKVITNFALNPDNDTLKQFDKCCNEDFVVKASLMPDAHSGYVAPIGSVLVTKDYVVPSWVGYDIGCGMIALEFESEGILDKVVFSADEIYDKVKEKVPMGVGKVNHIMEISIDTREKFKELLSKFKEGKYDDEIFRYLKNKSLSHLGSLGSGNHFIEICKEEENQNKIWLVIHSGSRGVGHEVALRYMKKASGNSKKFEATYPLKIDSEKGEEYMNILDFGLEFALLNRMEMAYKVRDVLREVLNISNLDFSMWTNKNHNHAIFEGEYLIHRKGATPAKKGERGVIPGNMRDGSFLVEGFGDKDFLESSSHGAGRIYSRVQAKKNISMKEFKDSMEGICGTVTFETLDEAPQAYKNINLVMEVQKSSVKIIKHLKPIINWKGEK
ncbi:MAG: RtcB family protein [Nanoarchaeota archaeon]|nr:RtcB family protein [Nanoarchaeota archaeon]